MQERSPARLHGESCRCLSRACRICKAVARSDRGICERTSAFTPPLVELRRRERMSGFQTSPENWLGQTSAFALRASAGQTSHVRVWLAQTKLTRGASQPRVSEVWRRRESDLTRFPETGLSLRFRRESSPRDTRVPLNTRSIAPNQPQRRSSTLRQQRGRRAPHRQLRGGRDPRRAPHRGRPPSATRPRTTAWVPSNSAWDPPPSSSRSPGIGPL